MKPFGKKDKGVVKGAPSGYMISIMIHAVAFLLAGLLIVFEVVKREEAVFVPPKAPERPKMKLKKPKVKVNKSSKPKPTQRIVTKMKRTNMPDIQLPEMSGMTEGLVSGIGGFEMLPDLSEVTIMGSETTIGNDFIGTFYDFKRTRSGANRPIAREAFVDAVTRFVRSGFRKSRLAKYYRSPKKLYATSFMVPTLKSSYAPTAFGEKETGGWTWMAHYEGKLVYPEAITFRFWGQGDDILVVRVDGKIVLNASWGDIQPVISNWITTDPQNRMHRMGNTGRVPGDWITLEPNVALDMEVVCGESPGGHFDMMLAVEVQGEEYPNNHRQSGPTYPMFKTAEPSHALRDQIFERLVRGEASVTNGPVFCDFSTAERTLQGDDEEKVPEPVEEKDDFRLWNEGSDKSIEAEFVSVIGDKVVLKNRKGKQIKLSLDNLTDEDREFIALSNPPKFNIDFVKSSAPRLIPTTPFLEEEPPDVLIWSFGVKLKQTSPRPYNYPVNVELFAIGHQYFDDRSYMLMDRQTTSFMPTRDNKRSHEFESPKETELQVYSMHGQTQGNKYFGYLILVTDSRGRLIQHKATSSWLYENRENLKKLPVGAFFDRTCTRRHPAGPKASY